MIFAVIQVSHAISYMNRTLDAAADDLFANLVTQDPLAKLRHDGAVDDWPITKDWAISANAGTVAEYGTITESGAIIADDWAIASGTRR